MNLLSLARFGKQVLLRWMWKIRYIFFRPSLPKNEDGKVFLNLGAGNTNAPGFVNIDAVPLRYTHRVEDIQHLDHFPDNSVDMVYASHVIEHIPRKNLNAAFKEWYRVLKPGGIIRFGVPDFDKLIEVYQSSSNDIRSIERQLMGEDGEYDDHHSIWNYEYAKNHLEVAGFKKVRYWDPETVQHHDFVDKTNRRVSSKDRDIAISLNVEANK